MCEVKKDFWEQITKELKFLDEHPEYKKKHEHYCKLLDFWFVLRFLDPGGIIYDTVDRAHRRFLNSIGIYALTTNVTLRKKEDE